MTKKYSCSEVKTNLSAFIDGELSEAGKAKLCEHLFECESCKKEYSLMKAARNAVRNYFEKSTENFELPEIPENIKALSKILFIQKRKRLIYSAAACALAVIIAWFVMNFSDYDENIREVKFKTGKNHVETESRLLTIPDKSAE